MHTTATKKVNCPLRYQVLSLILWLSRSVSPPLLFGDPVTLLVPAPSKSLFSKPAPAPPAVVAAAVGVNVPDSGPSYLLFIYGPDRDEGSDASKSPHPS